MGTAYGQDEKKQIVFWDEPFGPRATAVKEELIANFEAAHPDIEIVVEYLTNAVIRDILKTSILAGEGPDVIYGDIGPSRRRSLG